MISELTEEQRSKIEIYRKKWSDKFFSLEFDEEKAKAFVDFLYVDILKKKCPVKIILDSPLAVELAINLLKLNLDSRLDSQLDSQLYSQLFSQLDSQLDSQLRSQLYSQLSSQLYSQLDSQLYSQLYSQLRSQLYSQLRSQLSSQLYSQLHSQLSSQLDSQLSSQLRSQLYSQLFSQLYSQLRSQLYSQLRSQLDSQLYSQLRSQLSSQLYSQLFSQLDSQLSSQLRSQLYSQLRSQLDSRKLTFFQFDYWVDTSDYGWLAFYEYINKELFPNLNFPLFDKYLELQGNIQMLITFDGIAFLSKPPTFIRFDENNRLSYKEDYALAYADGFKMAFINGVYLNNDLFEKIRNKTITIKEILELKNVEQRIVALQETGFVKLLDELDYKKIDEIKGYSEVLKEEIIDELIEFKLNNLNIRAYKFVDYSTKKTGLELVEVRRDDDFKINTCRQALAWQCGLSDNFEFIKQT